MTEDLSKAQKDFQKLNERLANIIHQGIVPEKIFSDLNKKNALEVQSIKDLYEDELRLLRNNLDDIATEKSQIQLECMTLHDRNSILQKKYKDVYKRFKSAEADKESAESKIIIFEEKLRKVELNLSNSRHEIEKLQEKLKVNESEVQNITSILEKTKKQLREEMLAKVSLINELQTLKEDKSFKESLHLKELSISNSSINLLEEISFTEKLEELKKDFEYELNKTKENLHNEYVENIKFLENENKAYEKIIEVKDKEIIYLKKNVDKYKAYDNVSIQPELKLYKHLLEIGESSLSTTMDTSMEWDKLTPIKKAKTTKFETDFVEIIDVEPNGYFIKIRNSENKPANISGWRLIQTNENEDENMYKFRKDTLIDPGCSLTIWSNDSGKVTRMPSDIVMKNQHWSTGNEMKTLLLNCNYVEVSTFKISKSEEGKEAK